MKKVAVPTRENVVDDHFGHCEAYTVFTLDEQGRLNRLKRFLLLRVVDVKAISPASCNKKA